MPIVVNHLAHSYAGSGKNAMPALKDVSLTIREGEFLAVIGHTGSGKTTFIQHLNALLLPDSGTVTVDGLDTRDKKVRQKIRSLVGMVFQYPEYQLFADTVREDVGFGPKNRGDSPDRISLLVRTAMTQADLDYDTFSEKSPFELSGGEKRRAALAGVLAMQPKYLVLDEPMAGLDPHGRQEILNMLELLRKETGCAIIMVSHSMDDVSAYAERILVLQGGTVALLDTPEAVFSHYQELSSWGLSLPEASKLAVMLKEMGVKNIPDGICTEEKILSFLFGRLAV